MHELCKFNETMNEISPELLLKNVFNLLLSFYCLSCEYRYK